MVIMNAGKVTMESFNAYFQWSLSICSIFTAFFNDLYIILHDRLWKKHINRKKIISEIREVKKIPV